MDLLPTTRGIRRHWREDDVRGPRTLELQMVIQESALGWLSALPCCFNGGELEFESFRWLGGDSRILLRGCKRPGYRRHDGVQEDYPPGPPLHSSPRVTRFLNTMRLRRTSGLYIQPEMIISILSAWWSCSSKSSISENVLAPLERWSNWKLAHPFFFPCLCTYVASAWNKSVWTCITDEAWFSALWNQMWKKQTHIKQKILDLVNMQQLWVYCLTVST